jgi:two-component system NtrC family sensor kinase
MQTTLKAQLIRRFITVIFLTSLISSVVGTLLINNWTIGQAQERVRNSLNSARETLNHRLETIENTIYFASFRINSKEGLLKKDRLGLEESLENIRKRGGIDFLTITDKKGNVVLRTRNPQIFGDNVASCGIIQQVLSSKKTVSSIEIIPSEFIEKEGKEIALRCTIPLIETAKTKFPEKGNEGSAMALVSASPVLDNNENVIGVLFGGEILNKNSSIVDRVRDIVFQNEKYRGKDIGVVTIFLKGIRIATNYKNDDGSRAIGTEVSDEVYKRVLEEGQQWSGRALVIHD